MMRHLCLLIVLILSVHAFAEDIEVPEEELARESVLPVFSKRRAVLNRNVLTSQRFEVALGGALEMNEPYYNSYMFNGQLTYNFNETSALNVQGLYWFPGLSSYGNQLTSSSNHVPFDASKAPHPNWATILNYEYIAYYGKMSVTKATTVNLNTFGIVGLGYIGMTGAGAPAFNVGVGQNFFFTNNFGIRWDLRYLVFQGPNPASVYLRPTDHPSASDFGKRIFYNSQLDLGIVFIL